MLLRRPCVNMSGLHDSLLNGASLRMGTVTDVVDKVNGRYTFEIGVMDDEYPYQ